MSKHLTCLVATALLATPAFAEARGFQSNINEAITGPLKLEVVISEDLAHRANNLPKEMSDRGGSSRLRSAFSNNGKYGDKAIKYLIDEMQEEIVQDFEKRNIVLSDDAPTLLRVTINMAKPNRPTFNQLSQEPNLSFKSFGAGGADLSMEIIAAGGKILGTAEYDYYPSLDQRAFVQGATWADANRAMSKFSRNLSKTLEETDVDKS